MCSQGNSAVFVSELMLQERFGFSYKQLHALAGYWQVQGVVGSHTKRGGVSEYQLTDEGVLVAARIVRGMRVRFFGLVFGGVALVGVAWLVFFV